MIYTITLNPALLNDLPIITIAYDNVKYSNKPEKSPPVMTGNVPNVAPP